MSFRLQLGDGTLKDYPVVSHLPGAEGTSRTPCGAPDCEHLECAIGTAEKEIRYHRILRAVSPVLLALISYLVLSEYLYAHVVLGTWELLFLLAIACICIGMGLFEFHSARKKLETERIRLQELEEFRDMTTVNGMPARQFPVKSRTR